jgi:hypothetical protein
VPDTTIPFIKYFWAKKKSSSGGKTAMMEAAMSRFQGVWAKAAVKFASPNDNGYLLGVLK